MKAISKKGVFFAVLAACLYALNSPLSKLLLGKLSPTLLAGLLYLGAGVGAGIILGVKKFAKIQDEESNLKQVLNELSEKEKEIMCMRYGLFGKSEMTQKEVADFFEISQSYISRIEKKILEKMKVEILKLA